jgi:hypothetical protein
VLKTLVVSTRREKMTNMTKTCGSVVEKAELGQTVINEYSKVAHTVSNEEREDVVLRESQSLGNSCCGQYAPTWILTVILLSHTHAVPANGGSQRFRVAGTGKRQLMHYNSLFQLMH